MNRAAPLIGFGEVHHSRRRPQRHAFTYPTYFLLLPMRSLHQQTPPAGQWHINRPGLLSFFDTDHGDGRPVAQGGALAWLDELLLREGIADATGEVWLHTYPRVLGYTFKPVSFWYCHRQPNDQGGALRAIVVEVNNTFGERHCYLLDNPKLGQELSAAKVFHVSPFCPVEGGYRFRFMITPDFKRTVARIDFDDAAGPLIETSVGGAMEPLTASSARRALLTYPMMTFGVAFRIHWHALKLFIKKVPFFRKPPPPVTFTTR